ncbi:MAG TPA: DUF3618 domain-containing protein [Beutenbergiaceae bacterium]|nr:DUF3618 domain-containing protein [Beutenbergiaceae bacterium]
MSEQPETRKRSAQEIEADLARTRQELTRTVDELSERLDPRRQMTNFAQDLKSGETRAVSIVGGAVIVVAGVVGLVLLRRNR